MLCDSAHLLTKITDPLTPSNGEIDTLLACMEEFSAQDLTPPSTIHVRTLIDHTLAMWRAMGINTGQTTPDDRPYATPLSLLQTDALFAGLHRRCDRVRTDPRPTIKRSRLFDADAPPPQRLGLWWRDVAGAARIVVHESSEDDLSRPSGTTMPTCPWFPGHRCVETEGWSHQQW